VAVIDEPLARRCATLRRAAPSAGRSSCAAGALRLSPATRPGPTPSWLGARSARRRAVGHGVWNRDHRTARALIRHVRSSCAAQDCMSDDRGRRTRAGQTRAASARVCSRCRSRRLDRRERARRASGHSRAVRPRAMISSIASRAMAAAKRVPRPARRPCRRFPNGSRSPCAPRDRSATRPTAGSSTATRAARFQAHVSMPRIFASGEVLVTPCAPCPRLDRPPCRHRCTQRLAPKLDRAQPADARRPPRTLALPSRSGHSPPRSASASRLAPG